MHFFNTDNALQETPDAVSSLKSSSKIAAERWHK